MNNVIFSRTDHTVTGLNRPAGPAEYGLTLPFPVAVTKLLERTNGEKQKTNEEGQLLYCGKPVLEEDDSETVNEVTTDRIATAWEEVTQEYTLITDEGAVPISSTNRVATEWEDLEPVLIPNVEQYQVSFAEQPALFSYDDLKAAKLASIKKAFTGQELVHFDEDFELESFAVDLADHAANLGDGVIAVHPGGQCRTIKLPLGKSASTIRLYLEAQEGITVEIGAAAANLIPVADGQVKLTTAADSVYVRFTNTAESYREVYAFGLLA